MECERPIILLIEDNPSSHKMFKLALEEANYTVISAMTGASAIQELDRIKPSVILQDLLLPDMEHLELNHLLRTHKNGMDVPILALTGFLNKPENTQFSDEFAAFLIKPIELSRLLEVVNSFVPRKSLIRVEVGRGRRVLIVDDNRAQLKLLQYYLDQQGFVVDVAENGNEALDKINKIKPDVVISDVLMPGMDGFELCLKIRSISGLDHIPIILMTSQYLEESDRELAKKVSADYYMMRTADVGRIIPILNECMTSKSNSTARIPEKIELFKEDHTHRLIRQLEKQIDANASLAQRCALQYAQLSMLGEMANALSSNISMERTLENVLASCLDAAGISSGALYLLNSEKAMILRQVIGYNQEKKEKLEKLFSDSELLNDICHAKDLIIISSDRTGSHHVKQFLVEMEMTSMLLAPLISAGTCFGALLLGSKSARIENADSITFARNLSIQIGQAVALAKAKARALMNDKLATVGTLAASVAHEINNPISWVMNNLSLIKNDLGAFKKIINRLYEIAQETDVTKKLNNVDELFQQIDQNRLIFDFDEIIAESLQGVERVREIVKNLKSFSHMDAVDSSPVNVHEILNTAISMASLEFRYRAQLEKNYAQSLPTITAHSGKLHQVFVNLIMNASQAIPEGNLNNNFIRIKTEHEDQFIRVDIMDTGQGISEKNLPYIFEPFFTTKPVGYGTGLGLSICHEIISKLGGRISVKSKLNQGTTFSVYLPISLDCLYGNNSQINLDEKEIESKSKKILVIDDEPYLLKSLVNLFRNKKSYQVTSAQGGTFATEIMRHHHGHFDAIVCDMQMPDMNGAEFYDFVSNNYPGKENCILFITGGSSTSNLQRFISNTSNIVIDKPFSQEELFQSIDMVLSI